MIGRSRHKRESSLPAHIRALVKECKRAGSTVHVYYSSVTVGTRKPALQAALMLAGFRKSEGGDNAYYWSSLVDFVR